MGLKQNSLKLLILSNQPAILLIKLSDIYQTAIDGNPNCGSQVAKLWWTDAQAPLILDIHVIRTYRSSALQKTPYPHFFKFGRLSPWTVFFCSTAINWLLRLFPASQTRNMGRSLIIIYMTFLFFQSRHSRWMKFTGYKPLQLNVQLV